MAKKKVESISAELKELLKKGKLIFGAATTLKSLKQGKIARIILSSNCDDSMKGDIEYYCKLSKVEVVQTGYPNDELGDICKKPFSVSVLGVLK